MSYQSWNIVINKRDRICVYWYDTVSSTNTAALKLARAGASEWTVVAAAEQTAGRGRYQRQWVSPAGVGLWFSIILRPPIESQRLNVVTLHTALTVRDFLAELVRENSPLADFLLQVKWPNDIMLNNKKIGGLLFESSVVSHQVNYMVAGIGINILQSQNDFPPALQKSAISLNMLLAKDWDIKELLIRFLKYYHREYQHAKVTQFQEVVRRYERHLLFLNQEVFYHFADKKISGILRGVNQYGHLLVENSGKLEEISNGDIWMMKEEEENDPGH